MSTFLIITAVILWVGFSAFRKVKTELADPVEAGEVSSESARPAVESLFEERSSSPKASPYFTYETMEEPARHTANPIEAKVQSDQPLQPGEAVNFDLRQAVICQTILTNNYISEYQHQ